MSQEQEFAGLLLCVVECAGVTTASCVRVLRTGMDAPISVGDQQGTSGQLLLHDMTAMGLAIGATIEHLKARRKQQ